MWTENTLTPTHACTHARTRSQLCTQQCSGIFLLHFLRKGGARSAHQTIINGVGRERPYVRAVGCTCVCEYVLPLVHIDARTCVVHNGSGGRRVFGGGMRTGASIICAHTHRLIVHTLRCARACVCVPNMHTHSLSVGVAACVCVFVCACVCFYSAHVDTLYILCANICMRVHQDRTRIPCVRAHAHAHTQRSIPGKTSARSRASQAQRSAECINFVGECVRVCVGVGAGVPATTMKKLVCACVCERRMCFCVKHKMQMHELRAHGGGPLAGCA